MCTLECYCSATIYMDTSQCVPWNATAAYMYTHLVRVAENDVGVLVWPAYLVQAGYVGGVHV